MCGPNLSILLNADVICLPSTDVHCKEYEFPSKQFESFGHLYKIIYSQYSAELSYAGYLKCWMRKVTSIKMTFLFCSILNIDDYVSCIELFIDDL